MYMLTIHWKLHCRTIKATIDQRSHLPTIWSTIKETIGSKVTSPNHVINNKGNHRSKGRLPTIWSTIKATIWSKVTSPNHMINNKGNHRSKVISPNHMINNKGNHRSKGHVFQPYDQQLRQPLDQRSRLPTIWSTIKAIIDQHQWPMIGQFHNLIKYNQSTRIATLYMYCPHPQPD